MMYSAVNLRPYMEATPPPRESYVFLTLGYLNVILPGFLPCFTGQSMSDEDKKKALYSIFWLRVKYVRVQSRKALSSSFLRVETESWAKNVLSTRKHGQLWMIGQTRK